jgi:hypothetical protein
MSSETRTPLFGHNGGPPLDDDHVPEWGSGAIGHYFSWRAAHREAWRSLPHELMLWRLRKAERLGLTYEEYTLEILDSGRYLGADDVDRIAAIKRNRYCKSSKQAPGDQLSRAAARR